ncbi:TonB family protein [Mucilaginibacter sp. Bleaf8]|uniref:energy transducer TonB n=1 Tax=Mucilaginibacter sp. Bleaf8 TaxID=2834430 RepID=UPI001BCD18B2|nr:TonB family protein [Mucilaginibacter sp. Bleaf8]MBS7565847.1 TonB family protein [Mucilaginibacter sp. Bleaf8]
MLKFLFTVAFVAFTYLMPAQAQPVFKGGPEAFNIFIASHLMYPEFSRQNCIAAVIRVSFQVDQGGRVSAVRAEQGPGIDLDEEAVRVIKLTSGKWVVPAGTGTTRIILPVRFTPDYTRCSRLNNGKPVDMNAAILAYQNRQELENAVTNYYSNKYKGTADPAKEQDIIALKKQLGIDDEFLNDVLDQANQKLKQGDQEGACKDWNFIRNTGSTLADTCIAKYCK